MNSTVALNFISPEQLATLSKDDKLTYWHQLSTALAKLKAEEMEVRKAVVADFAPPKEGTNNFDLGNGYKLKIVTGTNYKLDDNEKVQGILDQIERIGNKGAFIAERLIGWTPRLSVSEYKKLGETDDASETKIKELIDTVISTSPASPTVEIVTPKA